MVKLSLEDVNEDLDDTVVRQLTLIQDYCSLNAELSTIMSRGFVQLAKSRMVLGQVPLSPSSGCFGDSTEEALITVKRSEGQNVECAEMTGEGMAALCCEMTEDEEKKHLAKLRQRMGGFMSPESLSIAQERFHSALERSIQLINLQIELKQGIETYDRLMSRKRELTIDNPEQ